jgi:glycosyltransferase involved in cell wall biosynthesis
MNNHFKIIIPFYNVEKWIGLTIKSVKAQKYINFQCIVVNDISTDNSEEVVNNAIKNDSRFVLINNEEKAYALKNIYDAIKYSNPSPEDIIITLDGDDWFASANVLSYLSDLYDKEKCWLTYGSYAEYPSGIKGKFARQIPEEIIRTATYRTSQWMTSHLRTFKYHLWDNINAEDMKDESGNFYQMTWDLSFMFPMLEMSGNKHRYIDEVLYIYNRTNPLNDDKVDHSMQLGFEREIRNKKKYERIDK